VTVPPLEELQRWVAAMPAPFREEPVGFGGPVLVSAVVADLLETMVGDPAESATLTSGWLLECLRHNASNEPERNRLRWMLAAAHLLWHPQLRRTAVTAQALRRLMVQDLPALAALVPVDVLDAEPDRREELIRVVLRALELALPGETAQEAADRLGQVDSVARHRLVAEAAERERRAREVREAMARKAATAAAAKVTRE